MRRFSVHFRRSVSFRFVSLLLSLYVLQPISVLVCICVAKCIIDFSISKSINGTESTSGFCLFFKNGPTQASFCLFSFFSNTNFTEKTVGVSGIRTRIVEVEGPVSTTICFFICVNFINFVTPHHNNTIQKHTTPLNTTQQDTTRQEKLWRMKIIEMFNEAIYPSDDVIRGGVFDFCFRCWFHYHRLLFKKLGSGCAIVGRAVTSYTGDVNFLNDWILKNTLEKYDCLGVPT